MVHAAEYGPRPCAVGAGRNSSECARPFFWRLQLLGAGTRGDRGTGAPDPGRLIHGIDIDGETTAAPAGHLVQLGVPRDQLRVCDFFALAPGETYGAVVGNPPYVRHHWVDAETANRAARAMDAAGEAEPAASSLWAPFVVHATRHVRPGGRLALVLPDSALEAQYAGAVHAFLRSAFARTMLIEVEGRIFDADVRTIVLLAAERGRRGWLHSMRVSSPEALGELLVEPSFPAVGAGSTVPRSRSPRLAGSARTVKDLVAQLERSDQTTTLGEVARVRLGVVTGANEFFVHSLPDAVRLGEGSSRLIISRSSWLESCSWTAADQGEHDRAGEPTRLLMLRPTS